MKVYVITAGEYSDYCIQAVTLNREKAELICAINNRNIRYSEDRSKIEEYDTLDTGAPVFEKVTLTPNPVDCGKTFVISVKVTD